MLHPTPTQDEIVEKSKDLVIRNFYKELEITFVVLHPFLQIKPQQKINFVTGNWPTKDQIIRCTEKKTWAEIIKEAGLKDIKELDRLLAYLHCARRTADKTAWLKLMNVVDKKNYIVPQVDHLPELITNDLFESIKSLGYSYVLALPYGKFERNYDIDEIIESKKRVFYAETTIATPDNKIVIATEFDQRFTYLSSTKETVNQLVKIADLEGFLCDDTTKPGWSYIEQTENIIDWDSPERYHNYN